MSEQLEKLKTERGAILEGAETLQTQIKDEDRKKTAEERGRYRGYMDDAEALAEEIDDMERFEAAQAKATATERKVAPVTEIRTDARVEVVPVYNKDQLRAFKGPDAVTDAFRASKWVYGHIFGNAEAREYCRVHGIESRVQVEGVNAAGGALVPDELDRAIINIRDSYGMARQECQVIQMGSDTLTIPRRTGGLTAYFVGETDAITESDTAWDSVTLTAKKLGIITRVSSDLNEDSIISITDMLADEVGQALAEKEDACLIDGDGTNTYGGMVGFRTLMSIASGNTGSYIQASPGDDQWGEYLLADINQLMGLLPGHSQKNAKWYMSEIAWANTFVRLMADAGGNTIANLVDGAQLGYMGKPVALHTAMPRATTAYNDVQVFAYGDLRRSTTLGARRGITLKVDDSRYLEYDQIAVRATERFDIVNHDVGDGATTGSLVGLLGQT